MFIRPDQFYLKMVEKEVATENVAAKYVPAFSSLKSHLMGMRSLQLACGTAEWVYKTLKNKAVKLEAVQLSIYFAGQWLKQATLLNKEAEKDAVEATILRLKLLERRLGIEVRLLSLGDEFKIFARYLDEPGLLVAKLYEQWYVSSWSSSQRWHGM